MGTLGGDFLSSLPLPEYPPAFPLGADIQGRTLVTRWGYTATSSPEPGQTPAPLQSFRGCLCKGPRSKELLWVFWR